MTQSKSMSLVESVTNIIVGYFVAVATQALVFPLFNIHINMHEQFQMGIIFSIVSVARSYILRRIFNSFKHNKKGGHRHD